jgi:hypothetical protein
MVLREQRLSVFVGREQVVDQPFPDELRAGQGMVLSVRPTGNAARQGQRPEADLLSITGFRVTRSSSAKATAHLSDTLRQTLLTVPRSDQQRPATHVALAANGDLLRGQLQALTADHLLLSSRSETIRIPRARLSALIWLDDDHLPSGSDPLSSQPDAVHVVARGGASLTLHDVRLTGDDLVGRHPELGACRLPLADVARLRRGAQDGRPAAPAYADWRVVPAPEPVWSE